MGKTNTYNQANLPQILMEMADYLQNCQPEEYAGYAEEIFDSGLFHDACGEPEGFDDNGNLVVRTDY